jgi:hypothetical protein
MNFRFFSLILLLVLAGTVSAQSVSGSFMIGLPQGEFANHNNNTGWGFQLQGTFPTPSERDPFGFGLNLGYMNYGSEDFTRPFSLTNPDVTVDVNRTYNLVNFHLMLLVSPFHGSVQPYMELLGGGEYLFTSTQIQSQNTQEEVSSSTNFDDFAWSYGFGGGIKIKVAEDLQDVSTLFVDLKVRYLLGSQAEYLTEGGVIINQSNGTVTYDTKQSETDMLSIHIGVSANL